jgi:hypothetical protein
MRRTSDEKRPSHILGGRWKSSAAQLSCERGKHLLQTSHFGKLMACRTLGLTNFHLSFGPSWGVFGQGFDYTRRFFMPKSAHRKIGRRLSSAPPPGSAGRQRVNPFAIAERGSLATFFRRSLRTASPRASGGNRAPPVARLPTGAGNSAPRHWPRTVDIFLRLANSAH